MLELSALCTWPGRVGVKIPQDGNRTNVHGHVAMVHEHVWRTLCSVCATGARVAHPVPCNFYRPDYNLAKKNIIYNYRVRTPVPDTDT
jgi:hypothetical protein